MEMNFGAPRRREVSSNKEKYETLAVLTVSAYKGKGTARALTLNAKAIEDLGIDFDVLAEDGVAKKDVHISFSFDTMKETVTIANTSGLEGVSGVRLAKTSKMASDKAYFDAIKKHFGINAEDEVEILLTKNEFGFNGHPTMNLSLLTATEKLDTVVEDAVAETAPVAELEVIAEEVSEEVLTMDEPEQVEEFPGFDGGEEVASGEGEGEIYEGFNV